MKPLRIQIPTSLKYLSTARESICSFGEHFKISDEIIYDIVTAVDEALSNIIEHNYNNTPDGAIAIELFKDMKKIRIIVEDKGSNYSFNPPDSGVIEKRIESRCKRGFGQFLIENLSSRVRLVNSGENGNKLVLEKDL